MVTYAVAQIKTTRHIDESLKQNVMQAMKSMSVVAQLQGYEHSVISETIIKDLSSFSRIKKQDYSYIIYM